MKKSVTLKDIANLIGLSVNTVSRVLNQKPYYTKEVEEKVLEAATRLGYTGNSVASSLRSGSSKTVAIVYDDMTNPYYSYVTNVVARKLNEEGYDAMIFSTYGTNSKLDVKLVKQIISRNVDAIISFLETDTESSALIKHVNMPILILGRDGSEFGFDYIRSDDVLGGELATEYLLKKGVKRIMYVGSQPNLHIVEERYKGYLNALVKKQISTDNSYRLNLIDYNYNFTRATKAIIEIKPEAIFCFNDIFAFNIMRRLTEAGFSIPNDYSIVGYDNVQKYLSLPNILTTVWSDSYQMANMATEVILAKVKGHVESTGIKEVLKVELIIGSST